MQIAKILAAVIVTFSVAIRVGAQLTPPPAPDVHAPAASRYACPMRCEGEKTYGEPGKCPVCKMKFKEVPGQAAPTKLKLDLVKPPDAEVRDSHPLTLAVKLSDADKPPSSVGLGLPEGTMAHVFVVSEDLSWFVHEYGSVASDKTIALSLTFPYPGRFVLFTNLAGQPSVDVAPFDIHVPGTAPAAKPLKDTGEEAVHLAQGFVVTPGKHEPLRAGVTSTLSFTISRDGKPVADLEPYLGSSAHLMLISEDLKHLVHCNPATATGHDHSPSAGGKAKGSEVKFEARVPAAGRYGGWLQFQKGGKTYAVPFVVSAQP